MKYLKDLAATHGAAPAATTPHIQLLQSEFRPYVGTAQAAHWLGRAPQTLRKWSAYSGKGPITAVRVHGRLMWSVEQIRNLLSGSTA